MPEPAAPKQPAPNLGELVEDALHQAKTLVQAEFSLARAELKDELKQALGSALLLGAGVMFLQAALVTFGVLLVLALGVSVGSIGVVLGLVVIAALLLMLGVRSAEQRKLPRTTARLTSDAKQVLESVEMSDTTALDTKRANEARSKLLQDIVEIKKMGNQMIDNTETAISKAPLMLGLGVAALVGVVVLVSRRQKPTFPGFRRERSFFAEAARNAALSALGVLSGRLTQRLLAGATDDKPRTA